MADLHKGHRLRVKKEFLEKGLAHFPPHKMLELLLFYSIPRSDTNEIGHRLIQRFGTLSGVFDADLTLIQEVPGIGQESALLIKAVSGLIKAYMEDYTSHYNQLDDTESRKEFMRYKFLCQQAECVLMACLGHNGKVIYCDQIAEGSPEKVSISVSLVVKTALRANAVGVVLAHNHPNGIAVPSSKDLRATSLLYTELLRVDVELLDHIIVAPDGVYSMEENNMLPRNALKFF